LKEGRLEVQEVSGTFSKKNFLLKPSARIPTEFRMKRDKFHLKGMIIQLENDQTVSHGIKPFFQSWQ